MPISEPRSADRGTGHSRAGGAIVVEIGSRRRRIDPRESRPRSLDPLRGTDETVLSWVLHALRAAGISPVTYVGDYHIEKVIERFPELAVRYAAPEEDSGELAALLTVATASMGAVTVIRGTTVLLPDALRSLPERAFVTTSYGSDWGRRPLGVLRLAGEVLEASIDCAAELVKEDPAAAIEDLATALRRRGWEPTHIELDGRASPVDDRLAVVRTVFQGKGATLDNLAPVSDVAEVTPRRRFTVAAWNDRRDHLVEEIGASFPSGTVVVRSSARGEDDLTASHAGLFLSVADVDPSDPEAIADTVDRVIASYGVGDRPISDDDEVLVQAQVQALTASGVVLTRDPASGAPYFVVNADLTSGRSDVVTSGKAGIETFYALWTATDLPESVPARPIVLARELVGLSGYDALDIEWGIDGEDALHLFQARPLVVEAREEGGPIPDEDVFRIVLDGQAFVRSRQRPRPPLHGRTTLFGIMPDWNPAEILGPTPKELALSLYQHLLGNEAWAEGRARIGYRDVRPESLIVSIAGRPYVDVRASLNSFLPADLDPETSALWTDACLEQLRRNPALHDKIEFEIAVTSMAPTWGTARARLMDAGLSQPAIAGFAAVLRALTQQVLDEARAPIDAQLASLDVMHARREAMPGADDAPGLALRARHLLDDCRRFGMVPFAILARYAFIGLEFVRGFRALGVLSASEHDALLRAIPTVATELSASTARLAAGAGTLDDLVERFGHLRPSSYDITSPNYRSDPDRFLRATPSEGEMASTDPPQAASASILTQHDPEIQAVLRDLGLDVGTETLGGFVERAIVARERAKFEFMKNLDAALETLAELGRNLGFDRDELAHVHVGELLRLDSDTVTDATRSHLGRSVNVNEKQWRVSRALRLPELVTDPEDLVRFQLGEWQANFVTREQITAPLVWLDEAGDHEVPLTGKVVVIRAADPGYDWIFGHGIAGLITEFGGAASHMAIRAGEFGLPAAIGCGPRVLEGLRGTAMVELDCEMQRVRSIP